MVWATKEQKFCLKLLETTLISPSSTSQVIELVMQVCHVTRYMLNCKTHSSKVEEITCGVPQGSCLRPPLFLIYINDLPLCLQSSEAKIYADDKTISYSSKSVDELSAMLYNDMHYLEEWLHGNKLTINGGWRSLSHSHLVTVVALRIEFNSSFE